MIRTRLSAVVGAGLIVLVGSAMAPGEEKEKPRFPVGTTVHGDSTGLSFTVHVPEGYASARKKREAWPVLVVLHEMGGDSEETARAYQPLAEEGRFVLVCPQARALGFGEADLKHLVQALSILREELEVGPAHLLATGDAGYWALRFAFARPKLFRAVVTLGTDVPADRPPSAAARLRLLVMKGADDRPGTAREEVEEVRDKVEVAEFRELEGDGRRLDPGSRKYVLHFLDAASGRCVAGRDASLAWREAVPGLAVRKARKLPALIYFFDPSRSYRKRTELIQLTVLFDPDLRRAAAQAVAILAPREKAGEVAPGARLAAGPALVVLDRQGKVAGVVQRKPGAKALAKLLAGL